MSSSPSWTQDRVETLGRLWRDGLSATQIAAVLGGVTRNAVMGKIHRLGLSGRTKPAPPGRRRAPLETRQRQPRLPRASRLPSSLAGPEPGDSPGRATILSIGRHACRWPIGHPEAEGFSLCGAAAVRGAYCEGHAALAYRPLARKPAQDHLLKLAGLA